MCLDTLGSISPTCLQSAFTRVDLKRVKNSVKMSVCFCAIEIWGRFHQCSTYSFYACRSQKRKKRQSSHQYMFTLSGSMSVEAVHRTLMKLTPVHVKAVHEMFMNWTTG